MQPAPRTIEQQYLAVLQIAMELGEALHQRLKGMLRIHLRRFKQGQNRIGRHFTDAEQRTIFLQGHRDAHQDLMIGADDAEREMHRMLVEILPRDFDTGLHTHQFLIHLEGRPPIDLADAIALGRSCRDHPWRSAITVRQHRTEMRLK